VLVSWEDGSTGFNWLEESVSPPPGKLLVEVEEGAVHGGGGLWLLC